MASFMIVDDSIFQRKNLEKIITRIGGEVVAQASNGWEALDLYPHFNPDIVLMDLLMPGMEGIETIEKIISINKNAKIIVISSIGYREIIEKALSLGVKGFIVKPFDVNRATDIIRSVVGL